MENPRLFYDLLFARQRANLAEDRIRSASISAPRSASSASCTPGDRTCSCIPTFTASFPPADFRRITRRWVRPRYPFFLPVKVLSRVFRGKFLAGLKRLHRRKKLCVPARLPHSPIHSSSQNSSAALHRHDWVVYAKPAFGGPMQVLRYLGRYTHRVAISNHRLLAFDGERVTFRWKDYAHGGKQGKMTLAATEFLRRFFLHVLPKGFVRIRHFGFLANARRAALIALARQQLPCQPPTSSQLINSPLAAWRCPRCGANMNIGPNLTAQQLAFRCDLPDTS